MPRAGAAGSHCQGVPRRTPLPGKGKKEKGKRKKGKGGDGLGLQEGRALGRGERRAPHSAAAPLPQLQRPAESV